MSLKTQSTQNTDHCLHLPDSLLRRNSHDTRTSTCGSPPTKSFRSSSSAIVTSDVSIDSAMLFDGNYKQSETEKVICIYAYRLFHDCFSWSLFLADYLWNFDRLIAAMLWISIVKHLKIWELQYFRGRLNIFLSFFWIINQLLTFKQSVLPYHVLLRAVSHTFTWVRQSQQPLNCAKDKGLECKQDVCDNSPKP